MGFILLWNVFEREVLKTYLHIKDIKDSKTEDFLKEILLNHKKQGVISD